MWRFADILGMGMPEIVVILVIVLLLFGGKKLPELSRSIGKSLKELRSGMGDDKNASHKPTDNLG